MSVISIIIPNYNGEKLLKKNLPKVINALKIYLEKNDESGEIIIIDDCSQDSSVEFIESYDQSNKNITIKLVKNSKNLGFSSTVNKGVINADGEFVVLLNTDVSPEENFLFDLLKHFKDEKVFAVGCLEKSIESGSVVFRGRGIGKWRKGFLMHKRGEIDKKNSLWASGGSSAFRKSIWNKLGGLYTVYDPFYWEDIDLSYRALKAGFLIVFEKESVVAHKHDEGAVKSGFPQSNIRTISYRNQFIFSWINITDFRLFMSHLFWLPIHLTNAVINHDVSLLKGFTYSCARITQIIHLRLKSQKHVVYSDTDVISRFNR